MAERNTNLRHDPILREVRRRLAAAYGERVQRVVLFGSRARGEASDESDYDLAVFLRGYDGSWDEVKRLHDIIAHPLLVERGALVSTKPFAADGYLDRTPLMHAIRQDGVDIESGERAFAHVRTERSPGMQPESREYLALAKTALADAQAALRMGSLRLAGREAYYAILQASRAYIFERTGKISKTHSGTRAVFSDLARAAGDVQPEDAALLGRYYDFKERADYGGPKPLETGQAPGMVAEAERFVATIERHLRGSGG